ncbi:MAG: hypothetical protein E3J23_05305 [Candidatus Stahlbacteria bacterium]|nr:MAG: hypothetical protein E3J23_05305 [Candidatus Stahlbacteria bacterium]
MEVKKRARISIVEILPLFLGALGLIMVFSAASGISVYERVVPVSFIKQLAIFFLAIILFFAFSKIKSKIWEALSGKLIILAIILLALTYFFGTEINYARRWLYIGRISIQPSILAQLALIAFLAKKRDFGISVLVISITAGLILFQPDISTALVTAFIGGVMMYLNGTDLWKVALISLVLLLVGVGYIVTQGYAIDRITDYINSDSISNTVKAIATGGWSGLGLGSGMRKFFYIPFPDSDFIFSIIGEELGFSGTFLVLGLFLVYLITASRYSIRARDKYACILGLGLISMIFVNTLIHIFVALGSIPVTGVPLPFISSGGTSLVTNYIAGGIIVSIAKNGSYIRRRNRGSYIPGALHS